MVKTVAVVTAVVLLLIVLWAARDVLMLVYVSALIAMGFSPLVRDIERSSAKEGRGRRVPRALAILLVYLVVVAVIVLLGLAVVPPLVAQAGDLWSRLPGKF